MWLLLFAALVSCWLNGGVVTCSGGSPLAVNVIASPPVMGVVSYYDTCGVVVPPVPLMGTELTCVDDTRWIGAYDFSILWPVVDCCCGPFNAVDVQVDGREYFSGELEHEIALTWVDGNVLIDAWYGTLPLTVFRGSDPQDVVHGVFTTFLGSSGDCVFVDDTSPDGLTFYMVR